MGTYIVTVKLPRNPNHDPHNKVTGSCPLSPWTECTDSTGEHHSILVSRDLAANSEAVRKEWAKSFHVTRVEEV